MTTQILERPELRTDLDVVSKWSIDPSHTQVGFAVKHLMIATVRGAFSKLEGTVFLDESERRHSGVTVSIDAASIDTGEARRDEHLRSADFLDVESHPAITFVSTSIEGDDASGGWRIEGDLTIRGVTQPVVLQAAEGGRVSDPWGHERRAFSASTTIDRRDFGLTWNQALESGGVLVGNEVRIDLEVQAVRDDD